MKLPAILLLMGASMLLGFAAMSSLSYAQTTLGATTVSPSSGASEVRIPMGRLVE